MLQAMVVNRKDGKGANKIEQNASNTCIPCSKPYRFPAQTTRKHAKTLSFFFAPHRFTGLRDCPTQCARLLHPASTRVLPVPQVLARHEPLEKTAGCTDNGILQGKKQVKHARPSVRKQRGHQTPAGKSQLFSTSVVREVRSG